MSIFRTESASSGNVDRIPYVKFNAMDGRMTRPDREQIGDQWTKTEEDVTNGFTAVMDLENIEVGWVNYPSEGAPSFAVSRIGEPYPARPSPDHKEGFVITLKLGSATADGKPAIRKFSGNAKIVRAAIDELYTQYAAGKSENPGLLPLVKLVHSKKELIENKHGKKSFYRPVFEIVKWLKRPDDLVYSATPISEAPAATPAPSAASAPPSTGSRQAEPPKAKVLEDDFAEF